MDDYRKLTEEEIDVLENNNCRAEDWSAIDVAEDFVPKYVGDTVFYGTVRLGAFERNIEVSRGFLKHSGISRATLRNVEVGNDCLIENIGSFINNYTIGDGCHLSDVGVIETVDGATFGQGNIVAVLSEAGDGNIVLSDKLNSQLAAFMVRHSRDKAVWDMIRQLTAEDTARRTPDRGTIGDGVKIVGAREITNTVVGDGAEIDGAARLSDCSIMSSPNDSVYVGTGVICENSIIGDGSSITDGAKIQDCFVGEACQITSGFTASSSVFFANSHMANGEACAAFCGPFSASHHKSSLLIGGMFSFYNAGSATNFSNHAYKMGPIHHGTLERGTKTASGCHILMPANIGTFSVCLGKLTCHPDTRDLPFSYVISYGERTYVVPGRNIATVGIYRDIRKWQERDMRTMHGRKSIINLDWLSPFSAGRILRGKNILEDLRKAAGRDVPEYYYNGYVIKHSALEKGIRLYDMALHIYMGDVLRQSTAGAEPRDTDSDGGTGEWNDLAGLLLPESEENRLADDIRDGCLTDIDQINARFREIDSHYGEYRLAWTRSLILSQYGLGSISQDDIRRICSDGDRARQEWTDAIRRDAEREFALGDVDSEVLENFNARLDRETDMDKSI